MHAWARWRSHWRFERNAVGLIVLAAVAIGCGARREDTRGQPLARIGGEVLDASVVQWIADRDGLTFEDARAKVADTLRLVAAARSDAIELSPERREYLRRGALARLWLHTRYEPEHGPEDIPGDDPLLERARADHRHVHPKLHRICQLLAVPAGEHEAEEARTIAESEGWRARALRRFEPAAERMRAYVQTRDPQACEEMTGLLRFEQREADDVVLRVESAAFVLDACAQTDEAGQCRVPRWVPEWVEQVEQAEQVGTPGFLPPFWTRFGRHLVFVLDVMPARELDDPQTEAYLREVTHPAWSRNAFDEEVERLHAKHTVRRADPRARTP
jgi:hypothetical protein